MHKRGGRGRWRWEKGGNRGVPTITPTLRIFNAMSLWDNTSEVILHYSSTKVARKNFKDAGIK